MKNSEWRLLTSTGINNKYLKDTTPINWTTNKSNFRKLKREKSKKNKSSSNYKK